MSKEPRIPASTKSKGPPSVARRLLLGSAAMALLLALVGAVSAFSLRWAVQAKDSVIDTRTADLIRVEDFIALDERAARKARSFLLTGHPRFLREYHELRALETQLLQEVESRSTQEDGAAWVERVSQLRGEAARAMQTLLDQRANGLSAEDSGRVLEREIQPVRDELDAAVLALKQHKERRLEQEKQNSDEVEGRAFVLLAASIGVSMVLTGVLTALLIRMYRQLAEAADFQSRIIAIVGHDLRSPLAALLMTTSHALNRPSISDELRGSFSRILRSARRIETLVRMLLDFTRSHTTLGLRVVPEPVDIHQVCKSVVTELEEAHPERTLVFHQQGNGRGDVDPEKLSQALMNLVDNAVRYGEPGAPITLESIGTNPSHLEVRVHNEGPPIESGLLPHIFEPFRHGDHEPSVIRESMGMGLYIVNQIVQAHQGRVEIDSSAEKGTTFTLRFPRLQA